MIDSPWKVLLFIKDFTARGADSFYWFDEDVLAETTAEEVAGFSGIVVCHDFWMIRDAVFDKAGKLPQQIVDLDEFRISTSGAPEDRSDREKHDITLLFNQYAVDQEVTSDYKRMFNRGIPFKQEIAKKAASVLGKLFLDLIEKARIKGELERYFNIEVPVYRVLQSAMSAGIAIDRQNLSEMRAEVEHEYFTFLKMYSGKHDMPLETPSRASLERRLLVDGFELDDVSIEYLLEYVPHENDFGTDTLSLQTLDNARKVLGSLTLRTDVIRPLIDVFGSRTSRVHLRSPSLQNIPKRYRSIIANHPGKIQSYVDFDQYEVGIMAALSNDEGLKKLFATGDMYALFATTHLGLTGNRKAAKQLFLSYAYGMSRKALVDAAVSLGVDRYRAKKAFALFEQYEAWKKSVWAGFQSNGFVATLCGNHYARKSRSQLTAKEQRSAVSQVVQGTASLIFKKVILEVSKLDDIAIILPMHDALLFEHSSKNTAEKVVAVFEDVMTTTLGGIVKGKASIGNFATG